MQTLLEVPEVAKELLVEPINVRRLIARGRIKAARLGDAGPYRITRDDLSAYATAGAPDFKRLELGDNGWWTFHKHLQFIARGFFEAVTSEMEREKRTVEQVQGMFKGRDNIASLDVTVSVPTNVRSLMAATMLPGAFMSEAELNAQPYRNVGEVFMVYWLWDSVRSALPSALGKTVAGLSDFYDSARAYANGTAAGLAALKKRQFVFGENYQWEVAGDDDARPQKAPTTRSVRVTHLLPFAALIDSALEKRLIDIAF